MSNDNSSAQTGATNSPIDAGALAERLGISITSASAQSVTGTMPVAGNTQPFGLLNGGASLALAETLGSIAANIHAQSLPQPGFAVGIDINGTHHAAARDGLVTGTAEAISLGKTVATYSITICDEAGTLLCTSRLTCLIRTK